MFPPRAATKCGFLDKLGIKSVCKHMNCLYKNTYYLLITPWETGNTVRNKDYNISGLWQYFYVNIQWLLFPSSKTFLRELARVFFLRTNQPTSVVQAELWIRFAALPRTKLHMEKRHRRLQNSCILDCFYVQQLRIDSGSSRDETVRFFFFALYISGNHGS